MARKIKAISETDPCGRCGCARKYHNPPKAYTGSKDYRNMGPKQNPQIEITARTSCYNCPFCICGCIGFLEPFNGQRFLRCVYDNQR